MDLSSAPFAALRPVVANIVAGSRHRGATPAVVRLDEHCASLLRSGPSARIVDTLVIHAHGHHEYQSTQEMIGIAELEKLWTIEGCTRSKKPE